MSALAGLDRPMVIAMKWGSIELQAQVWKIEYKTQRDDAMTQ